MSGSFTIKRILTLPILSYVFFFFGNSFLSLTDPDEVFYALTAKEMAQQDDWMTPYIFSQPQFEKPILTYWLLRAAFEWGSMTPFNARLFPAIFATLGVLGVYALGCLGFKNERKGFWSAVVLCTGALYIGMAKTIFTDMIFSVFILYALLSFYWAFIQPQYKRLGMLCFYIFAGLAALTKGPLGLLLPELVVILFLLYRRQIQFLYDRAVLSGFMIGLAIALPWYAFMLDKYGYAFIQEFFYNDHWRRLVEAEHRSNDRWYFYPLTVFMGLFPWALFLGAALVDLYKKLKLGGEEFNHFLLGWILVVFICFQLAHSKLASYILPLFPALALLCGGHLVDMMNGVKRRLTRTLLLCTAGFLGCLAAVVILAYPLYNKYLSSILPAYFLSGALVTCAGGIVVFIIKDRLSIAFALVALSVLPFLCLAFMIKSDLEPYVSTFQASLYLPHFNGRKKVILSSKPYARGVRFYTGEDVAVLNMNGGNYFSPHPIPILTNMEQLNDFFKTQDITYALVKKGGYETLRGLPTDKFIVTEVKTLGNNYILTIKPRR